MALVVQKDVFSYIDIFKEYYKDVEQAYQNHNALCMIDFDDFVDTYYSTNNIGISEYTAALVDEINLDYSFKISDTNLDNNISLASSSSDAYYVLGTNVNLDNTSASMFQKKPVCKNFNLFSKVNMADIVYETKTSWNIGHNAIIENVSRYSPDYGNYIATIEAIPSGVQYCFLDDNRMVDFGVILLGVNGMTILRRYSVINFAREQIGKPYDLHSIVHTDSIATSWYCSELVYASFYHVSIQFECNRLWYYFPSEIYESQYTYTILDCSK